MKVCNKINEMMSGEISGPSPIPNFYASGLRFIQDVPCIDVIPCVHGWDSVHAYERRSAGGQLKMKLFRVPVVA